MLRTRIVDLLFLLSGQWSKVNIYLENEKKKKKDKYIYMYMVCSLHLTFDFSCFSFMSPLAVETLWIFVVVVVFFSLSWLTLSLCLVAARNEDVRQNIINACFLLSFFLRLLREKPRNLLLLTALLHVTIGARNEANLLTVCHRAKSVA